MLHMLETGFIINVSGGIIFLLLTNHIVQIDYYYI